MNVDVDTGVMAVTVTALGLFGYTYFGYPVLLWLISRMTGHLRTDAAAPTPPIHPAPAAPAAEPTPTAPTDHNTPDSKDHPQPAAARPNPHPPLP